LQSQGIEVQNSATPPNTPAPIRLGWTGSGLSYPELSELKELVGLRMDEMREQGVPALRERFAEEAAALGVTLEDVVGAAAKKRGRPRKPRPQETESAEGEI
jgi:hypothetical protein